MHSFALSLSGGGLSSLAYAGFVDVLREHQLFPSHYAGLSGGAILSVLLASGLSSEQIKEQMENLLSYKLLNTHLAHVEIVDHEKMSHYLRETLPYKRFEELPTPVILFATNLREKEPVPIQTGDIASAIVASCSVFPLLQPIKRRGLILGDGGFTTYYGANYLRTAGAQKVVGVDVTGLTEGFVKGFFSALYKQINSSVTSNARQELELSPVDMNISISFPSPTFFTFRRKADHLIRIGRRSAKKNLAELKHILRKT